MKFKDKVVWITGASSGIGEHLAYAFAREGARLALSARNETELQRVRRQCGESTQVYLAPLDVTDFERIPQVAQEIISHFGYLNYLVNNAGISQRALVKNTELEVDRRIMDVNFTGTVAVTKAVLPTLLRQQFGHIVVISSVMGKIGTPLRSAYAASKHALHGFFDSLRAEVHSENVSVTLICPGFVQTNVTRNALKGDGSRNGEMAESTANGLPPDVFAEKALRAIHRKREEVYIGKREVMGVYLKRFFPRLLSRIVRKVRVT